MVDSGSEIVSANDDASFAKANRKQILQETGTNIEAATKNGAGQMAYATDSTSGKRKTTWYNTNLSNQIWERHLDDLLYPGNWSMHMPVSTTFASNVVGVFLVSTFPASQSISLDSLNTTEGRSVRYATGASSGNQAGFNVAFTHTMRKFCPSFHIKFRCNESSNIRFFAGWTDQTALIGNSDTPLTGINGYGVAVQTTQTDFRIIRNDAVTGQQSVSTGITVDTSAHYIDLYADDNGSRFYWNIDQGVASGFDTTAIPAQTTGLSSQVIYTTTTALSRSLSLYQVLETSDR